MDPSSLIPIVTPVVHAAALYLQTEALKKAGDKAAEVVGEKAASSAVTKGSRALASLRSWFVKKADAKAQGVLEMVELDPEDTDFQAKLIHETARLAGSDSTFEQELRVLAEQVTIAQVGNINQTFNNHASNQGAQGVINAPLTFNYGRKPDES